MGATGTLVLDTATGCWLAEAAVAAGAATPPVPPLLLLLLLLLLLALPDSLLSGAGKVSKEAKLGAAVGT